MDNVTITSENPQEPEGHNQAMIDIAEGKTSVTPEPIKETSERPEWLPEKFKTVEDMAKAYAELEKKQSTSKEPPPVAEVSEEAAKEELASKGLDLHKLSDEFYSNGELSKESYAALEKAGYDRQTVDDYIQGQQARQELFTLSVQNEVGGPEKYGEVVTWAKVNLSKEEIASYNMIVGSGSKEAAILAVKGLAARFTNDVGKEPTLVGGDNSGGQGSDVFESTAQMVEAMSDSRYQNDPAYRKAVKDKLGRSSIF